jgi:uncharacterized protein with ParB-like and HNH nuclease domain
MENINISEVIVSSSDWSVETILDQFAREHIQVNPNSQRRYRWDLVVKSRFIESIMLGFPIPQLVLAADLTERGKHTVVDGNQRLLSILEFYGESETENNGFTLTGLEFRTDLNGCTYESIKNNIYFNDIVEDLKAQAIRIIRLRNWQNQSFLDNIYSRLN